jgi:hypothetical protein
MIGTAPKANVTLDNELEGMKGERTLYNPKTEELIIGVVFTFRCFSYSRNQLIFSFLSYGILAWHVNGV